MCGVIENGNSRSEENEERTTGEMMIEIPDASIPSEPVNGYGIPSACMRCLEVCGVRLGQPERNL